MASIETKDVIGERLTQPGDPCVMTIFGASGDLTKRKLVPALYNLARENFLLKEFAVVGFARRDLTSETFRAAGTWGPKEADELLERAGRQWRRIDP